MRTKLFGPPIRRRDAGDRGRSQSTEIKLFSSIISAPNDSPALPIQNSNIFVHFLVRCANNNQDMFRGFFFVFGPPLLLAEDASMRL
jgi:hypothetical protein